MDAVRIAWIVVALAGLAPFADSLRLTWGQAFTTQRSRDRAALAALEQVCARAALRRRSSSLTLRALGTGARKGCVLARPFSFSPR